MSLSVSDAVGSILHAAVEGVSVRQNVIADNIANVDTPGYIATSVDFESSLRNAIADGNLSEVGIERTATDTPVGANGNNVDLRKETLAAVQSQFQYQVLTRAITDHHNLVKIAAGAM
ncbi:flagellar basal-body rod protein FlgB [Nocardioides daedukensis]|uniref:Flagellar basal body rod protein FlgB n=1 Tax=Nocardioides daedukensis TaxID=634462 RepID=A0A7Y9S247_9ACTN|nr:flagellar basal body protein [Nocardioides daedukensis]NYG58713.1 flagellar basal-body rod protein FlgB [Nocardioides daedukensis]